MSPADLTRGLPLFEKSTKQETRVSSFGLTDILVAAKDAILRLCAPLSPSEVLLWLLGVSFKLWREVRGHLAVASTLISFARGTKGVSFWYSFDTRKHCLPQVLDFGRPDS